MSTSEVLITNRHNWGEKTFPEPSSKEPAGVTSESLVTNQDLKFP